MATEYRVNIQLNTEKVKADLKTIKTEIDKLGRVNLGTNQRTQRTEAQITKSKLAQRVAMAETRRVGDLVQKAADQGLKVARAKEAVDKSALLNSKKEFKESKAVLKLALDELKIQRSISKEKAQQAALAAKTASNNAKAMAGGPFTSTGIASSRFGSVREPGSPRFIASRIGMVQGPQPASVDVKPSGPISSLTRLTANTPLGLSGVEAFPITRDLGTFGPKKPFIGQTTGFGRSPVLGRPDQPGSQRSILRVAKENTMPIGGFSFMPDSPKGKKFLANQQARQQQLDELDLQRKLGEMEEKSAKFRKQAVLDRKKSLSLGKGIVRIKTKEAKIEAKEFDKQIRRNAPRESLNFDRRGNLLPGPAGSRQRGSGLLRTLARNRGPALQSAAISGAFPLLFGQGPLAALGGGLGGGLGGAFGGQMGGFAGGLIGTAVVSGITNFANSITELGRSIETLDGQFNLLTEKSLFSSKEAENRAKILQALGEREKLATLLSKELTTVLGEGGAKKLREAAEASKELDKTFAELTINLQLLLAGPLTKFLKIVNDVLDPGTKVSIGEGKGNVIFGGKEEKFIENFKGVLKLFSQGQLDRIFKAAADLQINPADTAARKVLQAEGLSSLSNPELQAIRKFSLGKKVNPKSEFFGGDGSDMDDPANKIIPIDVKRVAAAQRKVKSMQKEVEFAKLVVDEGLKEADIQKQIQAITENLNAEELKLLDTQGLSVRALVEKNNQAKQLVENARLVEQSFKNLAQTVATDLSDGIKGLIRGTSTLNDVMRSVLDKMIDAAFNMAFFGNAGGQLTKGLGLFGNLFGGLLADGGPAKAGKSYIVGEKGPELFTPGVSGMVSPNSSLGGSTNIVVNVDASGSSVEGDEEQANAFGSAIATAIQSELIKQKRPGGLLA